MSEESVTIYCSVCPNEAIYFYIGELLPRAYCGKHDYISDMLMRDFNYKEASEGEFILNKIIKI